MKESKIEVGKYYRTRSGHKVMIYAADAGGNYTVHGAKLYKEEWRAGTWTLDGMCVKYRESDYDIISEWKQTIDDIGFDKSCLPKWAKFICMNNNGEWYWSKLKPIFSIGKLGYWDVCDESLYGEIPAEHAPKNYQGVWKDSLFEIE